MQAILETNWGAIQPLLRSKAGDAAFASWLKELKPIALERGTCHLEAPTRMIGERVGRLFVPLLEELLSEEFGTRISVNVIARDEGKRVDELEVGPTQPVIDDSNRNTYLVLRALAEDRDLPTRLILIYGTAGTGKSFLARWYQQVAIPRPMLYDAKKLRGLMQIAVRDGRIDELLSEFVVNKPLIIDGVHFFSRHTGLQRKLLRVLQERAKLDVPTILTSRHHPRDIWFLESVLCSTLTSGLVTSLKNPGPAARLQYLRALRGAASRNGQSAATEQLAAQSSGSYKEVREALLRQQAGHSGKGYLQLIDPGSTFHRLQDKVSKNLGLPIEAIQGKGQQRRLCLGRKILARLCVEEGLSQAEVGRYLGGRTRAAISYCLKSLEKEMAKKKEVRQLVEGLL